MWVSEKRKDDVLWTSVTNYIYRSPLLIFLRLRIPWWSTEDAETESSESRLPSPPVSATNNRQPFWESSRMFVF